MREDREDGEDGELVVGYWSLVIDHWSEANDQ